MAPVLARIADLPCASSAEVDRSGTLLRLRVAVEEREGCAGAVVARFAEAGYEARELAEPEAARALRGVAGWYTRDEVAELSREEARVLAGRIASGFARAARVAIEVEQRVQRVLQTRILEVLLEGARTGRVSLLDSVDTWLARARGDLVADLDDVQGAALEAHARAEIDRIRSAPR